MKSETYGIIRDIQPDIILLQETWQSISSTARYNYVNANR